MSTPICNTIACPYWEPSSKRSYGCQRYNDSKSCHLNSIFPELESNQYALYDPYSEYDAYSLRKVNEEFFSDDEKLERDLYLLQEFPDLADCSFVPKPYRGN